MRILVTGGAGFIGATYVRMLLGGRLDGPAPTRVTVLDQLTYSGNRANLDPVAGDPRLAFVHGDICDPDIVERVTAGCDAVLHLAAETHVDRSISSGTAFVATNVLGTQMLLEAAVRHRVGRFVQVSTDEVYGSIETGSWPEDWPLSPTSPYSASKAGADLLALAYHRTHGLPVVVTRSANNYGPYQYPEKIIPLSVTNLLDGGRVPLYGDGANVREWLHVDDHCRALHLVLARGRAGAVYNVGSGTELTNKELTSLLLDACGAGWDRVDYVADRKGHDRRYSVDTTLIRAELGFTPRVALTDGLARTVDWYRRNRSWWEPLKRPTG